MGGASKQHQGYGLCGWLAFPFVVCVICSGACNVASSMPSPDGGSGLLLAGTDSASDDASDDQVLGYRPEPPASSSSGTNAVGTDGNTTPGSTPNGTSGSDTSGATGATGGGTGGTDGSGDGSSGGTGGDTDPPVASGPKILPWLELNARWLIVEDTWGAVEGSEGGVTYGEYCIRGLNYWAKVTDSAVLTTHPDALGGTFEYVMANKPAGMKIYGGISTYSLPGCVPDDSRPWDFADKAGWQFIADEARHITSVTGNNVCVLENELSLTPFHRDGVLIDLDKLGKSLEALRQTGIEFWWYLPSIQNNQPLIPDMQARSIHLLETIATALPNCRFIVGYVGFPNWRENAGAQVTRRQMMIDMLGYSRILDYMITTRDGYWYRDDGTTARYRDPQEAFTEIAALTDVSQLSIYPGHMSWVTVAREFAEHFAPGQ